MRSTSLLLCLAWIVMAISSTVSAQSVTHLTEYPAVFFENLVDIVPGPNGELYAMVLPIHDNLPGQIVSISPDGELTPIFEFTIAPSALLEFPRSLAIDSGGQPLRRGRGQRQRAAYLTVGRFHGGDRPSG